MLTHKFALEIGRFIITSMNNMNISEDYNFLSFIRGAEPLLKTYFGLKDVCQVNILPVKHFIYPNIILETSEKVLKPLDYYLKNDS